MREFKIGERVTVRDNQGIRSICSVSSLTPRKMTLSNGSEWVANGTRSWGSSTERYYNGPSVWNFADGDIEKLWRRNALYRISRVKWEDFDNELLKKIIEVLPSHKQGA